jgi:hypothetical protein
MGEKRTSETSNDWETECPKREDRQHCNCWYDGEACCACGDNPPMENCMNGQLTFSTALALVKEGKRLQRAGWNGKGMFIFLVPGSTFKVNRPPLLGIYPEGTEVRYHGHVDMKTANGMVVPWLCSQTDLLAEDWQTVDD